MRKSIKTFSFILLGVLVSMFGFISVNAANRIKIDSVTSGAVTFSEPHYGALTKEVVASDLEKGIVTIELKFNNAKKTEIIFLVDNSTGIDATDKAAIADVMENFGGDLLDNMKNMKVGIMQVHPTAAAVTTPTNSGVIGALTDVKATFLTNVTAYENTAAADGQDFVAMLTNAENAFSETAENKIIVLITKSYNASAATSYTTALGNLGSDVKLYTVLLSNATTDTVFGTEAAPTKGTLKFIQTANLNAANTGVPALLHTYVASLIPSAKYGVVVTDYFTDNVLKAFDVQYGENPAYGTVAALDTANKSFTWTIGNLIQNDIATFRFNLVLKNTVAKDLINIPINTNTKVNVTFSATNGGAAVTGVGDYQCSPRVIILNEAITNPKTGVEDIVIPALIFITVALFAYAVLKRKEKFAEL